MATFTGKDGVLKIGADAMAHVRSWSLETTADPTEHSVIGDTWRRFQSTMAGFSVTIEGYYDITDTAQQALIINTLVAFELYPAGEVAGEQEHTGNGYVTAFAETAAFDGMVEFTATLQGTGELVTAVQP